MMKLDIRRILRIMDRDNAIRIARQYKDAISGHLNPTKVYLYGSYSKGTQSEDSDIDIAVVVPKMVGDWFANVPLLWTASRKINDLIEPVLIEECHPSPLYEDIMKTGIQI